MNTNDIHKHLLEKAPWVDPATTVDTVKAGDPTKEIKSVAVGWMSTMANLQLAHEKGCDLFITHEPTFWHHSQDEEPSRTEVPGIAKQKFLDETGLAILRIHDIWDPWPEIGIRDSWATGLGLEKRIAEDPSKYVATYEMHETSLEAFVKHVAMKVAPLGQDSVWVIGEPNWRVSHPAVGTGCGTPGLEMISEGADVLLVCDDGFSYWSRGERFFEMGVASIMVSHATSEMWGMENLALYISKTFPELQVTYQDKHPKYWTVSG